MSSCINRWISFLSLIFLAKTLIHFGSSMMGFADTKPKILPPVGGDYTRELSAVSRSGRWDYSVAYCKALWGAGGIGAVKGNRGGAEKNVILYDGEKVACKEKTKQL
ncbi:hypothetical protein PoB_007099900 [Plakobranchus ocellatus]|uniref:Uncharacterized protein n=1 Tax=Plakobranchus ocellatus TaxID=259542 RepID=A0AAV4DJV2_9GAST|nr:hypothetical protein PoB_007099900 [Plakobranchus ocellatus]